MEWHSIHDESRQGEGKESPKTKVECENNADFRADGDGE